MLETHDIAVIGAGGAGTMAYLRAVLNHDSVVMFTGDGATKRRGRATWVADVDNIPGMHDVKKPITSTSSSTLKWIAKQPSLHEKGTVVKGVVTKVERDGDEFVLHYSLKKWALKRRAKFVILATGLMDQQPLIGDSIAPIFPYANRGDAIYCVRCDGHRTVGKQLSVIGKDNSAVWIATMMHERYGHENIAILSNGVALKPNADTVPMAEAYGFSFHSEPIEKILGDPKGDGLSGFCLEGGKVIDTNCAIIALGTIVYSQLLKDLGGEVTAADRVVVRDHYETSVAGVFAVGDLVAGKKLQIYTAWDEAVDAADEVNRRLRSQFRARAIAAHAG